MRRVAGIAVVLLALALPAGAQEPIQFANQAQQERFERLTEELRCLVCQNQSLADSDAPLAHDLRNEVFAMLEAGHSDEEIKRFLVERYGDFVLYRPPVKGNTLVLWAAPLLLLFAGAGVVMYNVRRRGKMLNDPGTDADDAERSEAS